ncbi:TetR/AcrR family transcriptional regulator [Nannocystis bainbridge]|uniref:TetR/AcrR family transcriptional regulator n=1 Tax=Nannocystis bainbridge TaxID=2995303 RepID=A0ABT5DUW1_9BACT|nr:TetR/AcrR family transcriptional regulator [Nannocystis bainbridge]MDC0716508.1 TetR/AcrR family transcriptional regulator [Nannocystis bainbridge]
MSEGKDRPSRGRRARRPSGDDREQAILTSFEKLLEQRALPEISIDDIARGAGISRPTFYFYFPSKDAVLLSLLDRMVEQARAERDAALASAAGDPARGWRAAIETYYRIFRAHRAVSVAAADARVTNPEVRALWSQVMTGLVEETAAAIEAERARGAARCGAPARDLAVALNWMNERVLHAGFADHAPMIDEARVVDVLLEIWLATIYGGQVPR